jgi:TorA maturation chaperone TorD
MGGLIVGRFGKVTSVADQKSFFNAHVGPWAVHFFSDLEASRTSVLYSAVGSLGRQFMEIEAEAFEMLPN